MHQFIRQVYKKEDASGTKTAFLDRDGVLVKEVKYLAKPEQLRLLPGVIEGIKKLNSYNIVVIVVTNQPVVARGRASVKDVKLINDTLVTMLNKKNAYINAVYFCPHHPEKHHPDIPPNAAKYRIECECRKPKIAMFRKAIEDFNINLEAVFLVGDTSRDIMTGKNLGIPTILVGDKTCPFMPDYTTYDFSHAVDIIIHH